MPMKAKELLNEYQVIEHAFAARDVDGAEKVLATARRA